MTSPPLGRTCHQVADSETRSRLTSRRGEWGCLFVDWLKEDWQGRAEEGKWQDQEEGGKGKEWQEGLMD